MMYINPSSIQGDYGQDNSAITITNSIDNKYIEIATPFATTMIPIEDMKEMVAFMTGEIE